MLNLQPEKCTRIKSHTQKWETRNALSHKQIQDMDHWKLLQPCQMLK